MRRACSPSRILPVMGVTPPPHAEFLHCVQDDKWGKVAKESIVLEKA